MTKWEWWRTDNVGHFLGLWKECDSKGLGWGTFFMAMEKYPYLKSCHNTNLYMWYNFKHKNIKKRAYIKASAIWISSVIYLMLLYQWQLPGLMI